jgi:hypothetical protein
MQNAIPRIDPDLAPLPIHGTAALAHRAFAGADLPALLASIHRPVFTPAQDAALTYDTSLALRLTGEPMAAAALQFYALGGEQMFRVAPAFAPRAEPRLRLLALVAPGDLMVNTPLDFLTAHLDVDLDLLFVRPGRDLPAKMPDHDVAFFAVSESDPATLARLAPLFATWPRPALNDPARVARLTRDGVARGFAALPGTFAPPVLRATRAAILAALNSPDGPAKLMPGLEFPLLLRPFGSHAGAGLVKADDAAALRGALAVAPGGDFFLSPFVDYAGPDGLFRKYRVAFIDGAPFLVHMAVSEHWMVHYLNAGMTDRAERRDAEAAAMANFDRDFARRHQDAFAALNAWVGLDYHQIDCAETRDGRLLVFEADVAAIVHMMDPPDLFPYKPRQMRRLITAFSDMLRRRAGPLGHRAAA